MTVLIRPGLARREAITIRVGASTIRWLHARAFHCSRRAGTCLGHHDPGVSFASLLSLTTDTMTAYQPQLEEAARVLIQWARARQAGWRDPSSELMAALGNRYETLRETDPPPAVAAVVAQPSNAAVVAPPPPARPVNPAAVLVNAPDTARQPARPAVAFVAPEPPPAPVPSNQAPAIEEPRRRPAAAASSRLPRTALAAAVILAAVAAPKLWRSYAPAAVAVPQNGTLSLDSNPPGSSVLIDGVEAGTTPLQKQLGIGVHTVEFRYKKASRTIDVTVVGGENALGAVDWTRKPVGTLYASSNVAATKVYVDGKLKGHAPLAVEGLSAGTHTVVLRSAQGSVKQTVTVKDGQTTQLPGSIYPGSLHVSAPFEVQVSEGGRLVRLDDKNEVVLPPGPHKLLFVNSSQGVAVERTIEVEPGKRASVTLSAPAVPAAVPAAPPVVAVPESPPSTDGASTPQEPPPAADEPAAAAPDVTGSPEPAAEPAR
jgi:hypothetical protein